MACHIVTFEPIGPGASEAIQQSLKELGFYCPIHAHCWAVVTEMTAAQLRDRLMQVSPASKMFVVRSGTEAAWSHSYGNKNSEWLKKYL